MNKLFRIFAVLGVIFGTSFFGFVDSAAATNTNGITADVYNCNGWNASPPRPCPQGILVNTTIVSEINFNWGSGPVLSNRYEDVEVKFTGYIMSPVTKTVTFYAPADDGVHFTFNNNVLINDWVDKGGGGSISQPVTIQANIAYPFTFWYYENGGGANVWLYWNDGSGNQIVPSSVFYITEPTPPLPPSLNAPTGLSLSAQSESISLSWTAPAPTAANTAVERYAISWSTSNFTTNGWGIATGNVGSETALNTFIIISNSVFITNGTGKEYQFKIRADNDSLSTYSSDSNIVTLYVPSPLPFTPQHTINENDSLTINAPEEKLIDQITGWYGNPNDGSQGLDVSSLLTQQFTNLATANFSATNTNFTDPVPGVGKILILSITYKDAPQPIPTPSPTPTEPLPTPTSPAPVEPSPEPSPTPEPSPQQPPTPEPPPAPVQPPTPEPPPAPVQPPTPEPPSVPVQPPVIPNPDPVVPPDTEPEQDPDPNQDSVIPVEPETPVDETPIDEQNPPIDDAPNPEPVPVEPDQTEVLPPEPEVLVEDNTETQDPQETTNDVQDQDVQENLPTENLSKDEIIIANILENSGLSEKQTEQLIEVIKETNLSQEDIKILSELIKSDPIIAQAVQEFSQRAEENANAPMPYTLADVATELQAEEVVSGLTEVFTDPAAAFTGAAESFAELANFAGDLLSNPAKAFSNLGSDMTDDQREKAQEVIIPVIIVSQVVNAVAQILSARRM